MTDRNAAYKADVNTAVKDDPLAELARIVSGDTTHSTPSTKPEPVAPEVSDEMDLEAELMRELSDELDEPAVSPISEVAVEEPKSVKPQDNLSRNLEGDLEAELMQELDAQPEVAASVAEQIAEVPVEVAPSEIDPIEVLAREVTTPSVAQETATEEPVEQFFEENFTADAEKEFISQATPVATAAAEPVVAAPAEPAAPIVPTMEPVVAPVEKPKTATPEPIAVVEEVAANLASPAQSMTQTANGEFDFGQAFSQQVDGLTAQQAANSTPAADELEQGFADAFADELDMGDIQVGDAPVDQVQVDYASMDFGVDPALPAHETSAAVDPSVEFADDDLDTAAYAQPEAGGGGKGFKMALSALGLALVAGLGVVGWGALTNSTTGDNSIIIKADNDPVKVKPADPGGKKIENIENKVYESVAGNASTETQQDSLVDSSQTPIDISKSATRLQPGEETTSANNQLGGVAAKRVKTLTIKQDGTIVRNEAPQPVETVNVNSVNPEKTITSVNTELTLAETKPSVSVNTPTVTQTPSSSANIVNGVEALKPVTNIPENAIIIDDNGSTATRSVTTQPAKRAKPAQPKPKVTARPTSIINTQPVTTNRANDPNAPTIIAALPSQSAPAATPTRSSGWSVQISSQRSPEAAQRSYVNLRNRFSSVLNSREVSVQRAVIKGKGTFYRVKIPASSRSDANSVCNRLKRAGGSCFVTR